MYLHGPPHHSDHFHHPRLFVPPPSLSSQTEWRWWWASDFHTTPSMHHCSPRLHISTFPGLNYSFHCSSATSKSSTCRTSFIQINLALSQDFKHLTAAITAYPQWVWQSDINHFELLNTLATSDDIARIDWMVTTMQLRSNKCGEFNLFTL